MRPNFYHHLHPPTIPARQARLQYTLGAGGLSVYLMGVVIVTGILEMFYYIPTPAGAPLSIQELTFLVPFGWFVRNLHYWSSQLLVAVVGLHLVRVVWTGAYAPPRRFNYWLGLIVFVVLLLLDFTGYVLRWDEGVRWAFVAGINLVRSIPWLGAGFYAGIVGGSEPGGSMLIRFYTWHIFGLMLAAFILATWHLFRVRRDGGIAVPPPGDRRDLQRIDRFELARREALAALWASVTLFVLASFWPAPLAAPIEQAGGGVADAHAPWFFLWIQELLKFGDPFIWGVLVPSAILLVIAGLPLFLPLAQPGELGEWLPRGNRAAQVVLGGILVVIAGLTLLALLPHG
jgi:quinol-cytochrome oxidoreductase complex cytochrome b subunit